MAPRASRIGSTALAITALFAASSARANEPNVYGLGSRSAALAGAVTADATDFSGNFYNPAALVGARGVSLSIGYLYADNRLAIDGRDTGVSDAHGLSGGVVAPGKIAGIPFAFGIGTFIPDAGLSRVKALRQETPRWALYDERASILFLAANLAIRPLKWLELGGGVAFLAATQGRFAISGGADILEPYNSKLRHEVDADLTSVRYPQLGMRLKVLDFGFVGLTYRGETKLQLSLDAHLAGRIFLGSTTDESAGIPLLYDLQSRTVDAFLPQQVVVGLSFQKIHNLKINFDLAYVNWAAYQSPTAKTKANLDVQLPPGTALELPANPKPTRIIPPGFSDRVVPRLGVEYLIPAAGKWRRVAGAADLRRLIEIPVRAGYVYERSPVPPQTSFTNFVDADRHTLTLGSGITINAPGEVLPGSLRWDVHGQFSIFPERITLKDNPADFVGDYRASGTILGVGSTITAEF